MNSKRYMPILDWTKISVSAPGSFVLVGEYADLYDKDAIAITVDRHTKVTIRTFEKHRLRLNLKNFNDVREWPTASFTMTRLVKRYNEIFNFTDTTPQILNHLLNRRYKQQPTQEVNLSTESSLDSVAQQSEQVDKSVIAFLMLYLALGDSYAWSARPSLDVEIESDIPFGRGYGSSSSYGVALCTALMKVFRISAEPAVINHWALNVDKYFHGRASGLHTSAIVYGGYVYFQNGKVKYSGVPHSSLKKVLFIDTNIRRDYKTVVNILESHQSESSNNLQATLDSISDSVLMTWRKLNDPFFRPDSIATHLIACQDRLDALGLGNENLSDIRSFAANLQLAVKQTKSGQSAFLIYDDLDNSQVVKDFMVMLSDLSYKHESFITGCKGVKVISIDSA